MQRTTDDGNEDERDESNGETARTREAVDRESGTTREARPVN
jgi:hypothetical protein